MGAPAIGPEPLWRELAGAAFRAERLRHQRTLRQVADRAGISPQYLSEIERGRKEPSSEMVASLCGALDLTLGDLLSRVTPLAVGDRRGSVAVVVPMRAHRVGPVPSGRPPGVLLMAA